jgi:hypothetical protein
MRILECTLCIKKEILCHSQTESENTFSVMNMEFKSYFLYLVMFRYDLSFLAFSTSGEADDDWEGAP